MPMMWFRQRVNLTEDLANQAKVAVILPKLGLWTAGFLGLIGFCILITATYNKYYKWNRGPMDVPLLE